MKDSKIIEKAIEGKDEPVSSLPVKTESFVIEGVDLSSGFESNGFEEQNLEFFDLAEDLIGVELEVIMREITQIEIKGENRDFVKMYIRTTTGHKMVFAGQAKIVTTFKRVDKGKGVFALLTFLGKVSLPKSGGKTLNDFRIKTKTVQC